MARRGKARPGKAQARGELAVYGLPNAGLAVYGAEVELEAWLAQVDAQGAAVRGLWQATGDGTVILGDEERVGVLSPGPVVREGARWTGAELLPGRGAFLRVEGATVRRLQAYLLDDAGTESLVDLAQRTYGAARAPGGFGGADAPVRTGAQSDAAAGERGDEELAPVRTSASTGVQFPLPRRAPTLEEAAAIRRLRAECGSQNDLVRAVYGSKSSDTNRWVREALAAVAEVPAVTSGPARILRMGVR